MCFIEASLLTRDTLRACCRTLGPLAQGVKPGVSLAAGVACEFVLAFLLNLAIFASMGKHVCWRAWIWSC